MPTRRTQLLTYLAQHPGADHASIQSALGVTRSNLSRILADALADEVIVRRGRRRGYRYYVAGGPRPGPLVTSIFTMPAC